QASGERRLALARADDEIGPTRDGARPLRELAHGLLEGGGDDERVGHCSASQTRSGDIGSSRTRLPVATAIPFATAPGVGTHGGSPMPFEPVGPPSCAGVSTQPMSIAGASAEVTSL